MHTVSQVRHLVSLVSVPSNSLWTNVESGNGSEFALFIVEGTFDPNVVIELDTEEEEVVE